MHVGNTGHLIGHASYIFLFGVLIVSTIIFYNSDNLVALLYLGWLTLALGVIFLLWASQSRKKGRIRESISKESFVESGMYAFVRHPEFLGHILIISALVMISQHWISLTIGVMLIILLYLAIIEEEKRNIEMFGDMYRGYIRRIPRINLLIGILKRYAGKGKENKK